MELNKQCKRSEYKQDAKRKQERLGTERGAAGHGELALPPASAAGLSVRVSEVCWQQEAGAEALSNAVSTSLILQWEPRGRDM